VSSCQVLVSFLWNRKLPVFRRVGGEPFRMGGKRETVITKVINDSISI
jgi:hypothetical protein